MKDTFLIFKSDLNALLYSRKFNFDFYIEIENDEKTLSLIVMLNHKPRVTICQTVH